MMNPLEPIKSPAWSSTVKLFMALAVGALVFGMAVRFQNIMGPLMLAFLLAYILQPMVKILHTKTGLSWSTATGIVFLVTVVAVVGIMVVLGIAIVDQVQSLIGFVNNLLLDLPRLVDEFTQTEFRIGPFSFGFGDFDIDSLLVELANVIRPAISEVGSLVSSLASSTLTTIGWLLFVLLVSYFTLNDTRRMAVGQLVHIDIPGYEYDVQRLGARLSRIWNTFLRSQFFLFVVTIIASAVLNSALGMRNALALAIMAGLGRFVPYAGPFVTWTLTALVALFMPDNYMGLAPFWYAVVVVGAAVLLDSAFDQYITPQLYGQALGVNPGMVLVAAIVAANLLGVIGFLVAAPVLATLALFGRYIFRKMFDLDPWPESEQALDDEFKFPGSATIQRLVTTGTARIKAWRKKK